MAEILPTTSLLPTIMEGESISFTFESQLLATETLVEFKIISTNFPNSINVNGATFSGSFSGLFTLPDGSLKYRDGDDLISVNSFSSLPPKGTVELYSYTPPNQMLKNFNIVVSLTYLDETSTEPLNITKSYTQPVQGNWNTFRDLFLAYVR